MDAYAAPVVLLVGAATFAASMGLGLLLLRLLRTSLPAPFCQIVAVLLGIQAIRLSVRSLRPALVANFYASRYTASPT